MNRSESENRDGKDLETQVVDEIRRAMQREKGYATFWDWPDKTTKERGIICDLLESIKAVGGLHGIIKVRRNQPDPPDCVGTTDDGKLVAFEATEFVDQETVEQHKRGQGDWKEWNSNEVVLKIKGILKDKDEKHYHGGPYSKLVLVIHTDEPLLRYDDCKAMLRGQHFERCKQISEVYLLFSYVPGRESHPFLRMGTDGQFE